MHCETPKSYVEWEDKAKLQIPKKKGKDLSQKKKNEAAEENQRRKCK